MVATVIKQTESIPVNKELFALTMNAPLRVWPQPEEMDTSMPWRNADAASAQRMATAKAFADVVLKLDLVESVWVRDAVNGFEVCVVVSDADLDFDLSLRERFIDLVAERLGPGEGDIFIYKQDDAPGWVFEGIQVSA